MPLAKKAARTDVARRIQMLPIDQLIPSPDHGRGPMSAEALRSLARSIKRNGVLQPILVRPHPQQAGRWEIRAGFRRWRASKMAGLTRIPAIVGKLDDETALVVTITENLQRENPHPLEEAVAIQKAFDYGFDAKAIAARLGKSVQFVARRASLTRLTDEWRNVVMCADTPASRLSPAHLELIARLPDETQRALAQQDGYPVFSRGFPTVQELARLIDAGLHSLASMPWSLDDETLDPKAGACRNCPKRSGVQPLLFDGEDVEEGGRASKSDRCLDPACFERKQVAHVLQAESELRAAHPNLVVLQIGGASMTEGMREAFGDRAERRYAAVTVKASHPNAVPAMQVDGPKAGKLIYIHGGDSSSDADRGRKRPRPKEERKPATLPERQARHQKRRQAFVIKQVEVKLRELSAENVARAVAARSGDGALEALSLLLSFGTSGRADRPQQQDPWERYDQLRSEADNGREALALLEVSQVWLRRLVMHDSTRVEFQAAEARRMCAILGIDFAAIEAEAIQALPQPKSWGLPREIDTPLSPRVPDEVASGEIDSPKGSPGCRRKTKPLRHRNRRITAPSARGHGKKVRTA